MKLIFLYGSPAVGKLTVAQQLATRTDFKLFHNHLAIEVATSLFEQGSTAYFRFLHRIHLAALEEAAQANLEGVIFTHDYVPSQQTAVAQMIEAIESKGGTVCFVWLYCDPATLENRMASKTGKPYGKIITVAQVRAQLNDLQNAFVVIPERDSLSIDTSSLAPEKVASRIIAHYGLPVVNIEQPNRSLLLTTQRRAFLKLITRWVSFWRA